MSSVVDFSKYAERKGSGSDWLGEVPHEWNPVRFKYLAKVKKGTIPKRVVSENHSNLPPYLSMEYLRGEDANHFVDDKKSLVVSDGAILLLWDGSNAGEFVRARRGVVSSTLASVDFHSLENGFAWYACQVTEMELRSATVGMGIPHVDGDQLRNSILAVPPKPDQGFIARFLDKKTTQIDEAIAIKEQQIALLKERKQIIIQKAVTQGLNRNVPMKDSGMDWIGEIPAHWEMKRVKNIFRMVMDPSEKNNDHELLSVYTGIGVKPRRELEERGNKASTTDGYWFVKKGDIVVNKLLAWMGAIGLSEYQGVTSPAYDVLRPQLPVNGYFYHYLFRSNFCSAELKRHSRGIMDMRLRLYFDKFGVIEVPYPPLGEQDAIISSLKVKMEDIDNGIDHLKLQIGNLKEYKTTLINSAVTGKIKITPDMVED